MLPSNPRVELLPKDGELELAEVLLNLWRCSTSSSPAMAHTSDESSSGATYLSTATFPLHAEVEGRVHAQRQAPSAHPRVFHDVELLAPLGGLLRHAMQGWDRKGKAGNEPSTILG
eukprot:scaffold504_cov240-Pinguiococcus_pyrenoidosus.AAC.5